MFKKKSWSKRIAALFVMTACIGGVRSTPALAQNVGAAQSQVRAMRVRNVRPGILAWWLDPKSNPEPYEIRVARMNTDDIAARPNIFGSPAKEADTAFDLSGIQKVLGIDAQNVILAVTNDAGWEKLQRHVQNLDKPIPQVEISLTQVEISENDAVPAGWWKRDGKLSGILKMPTSKYEETLQALQKTGRIKIINSPRITAMNNLPASLGRSAGLQPAKVTLDTGVAPAVGHDYSTVIYPSTQFMMKREWRVTATPTVNNDGSITLALNLAKPLYLVRGSTEDFRQSIRNYQNPHTERQALPELLLEKGDKLTSVINLKSDETILVADHNDSTQGATAAGATPEKDPFHRLIFVSARRINTNQ